MRRPRSGGHPAGFPHPQARGGHRGGPVHVRRVRLHLPARDGVLSGGVLQIRPEGRVHIHGRHRPERRGRGARGLGGIVRVPRDHGALHGGGQEEVPQLQDNEPPDREDTRACTHPRSRLDKRHARHLPRVHPEDSVQAGDASQRIPLQHNQRRPVHILRPGRQRQPGPGRAAVLRPP